MNPRITKKRWRWLSKAGPNRNSVLLPLSIVVGFAVTTSAQADPSSLIVTGRVFCGTAVLDRIAGTTIPVHHEHLWGFQTQEGRCLLLLRARYSEALFLDERLREKELVLKGKASDGNAVLDVATIRSLKEGAIHDLYYYCNICAIKSVAPEICSCCQGPVELIEKPLAEAED